MAVSTDFSLTGLQKLGQPVPDSNLWPALKSLAPQQTQRNTPLKWPLAYLPEKAGSVAFMRVTMNCSGVSRFCHSSCVRNIRSGSLAVFFESFCDSNLVVGSGAVPNGSCPSTAALAERKHEDAREHHGKTTALTRIIITGS